MPAIMSKMYFLDQFQPTFAVIGLVFSLVDGPLWIAPGTVVAMKKTHGDSRER